MAQALEARGYIANSFTGPTEGFRSNMVLAPERPQTALITIFKQPGPEFQLNADEAIQAKLDLRAKEEKEKLDAAIEDAILNEPSDKFARLVTPQEKVALHAAKMAAQARGQDPDRA